MSIVMLLLRSGKGTNHTALLKGLKVRIDKRRFNRKEEEITMKSEIYIYQLTAFNDYNELTVEYFFKMKFLMNYVEEKKLQIKRIEALSEQDYENLAD